MNKNIKIAVLGASGYTGGDLLRILLVIIMPIL